MTGCGILLGVASTGVHAVTAHADLVTHLRTTAARLRSGAPYRWTHQGHCNCGHLAQTLTGLGAAHLHALAVQSAGEWVDHARDFCPTSGRPVDAVIAQMLGFGLTLDQIADLERLADPLVLRHLPDGRRHLDQRRREDVVLYFETWAALVEAQAAWRAARAAGRTVDLTINGRPFCPIERPTAAPLALDEHPDAGRHAA
jgi:hypothetical protein